MINQAKTLLYSENNSLVLCKDKQVYNSKLTGIAPLLLFLGEKIDLNGYCAADRVVGKAAALLFVLAGVKEVFAEVLSKKAAEIFDKYKVEYSFDVLTDSILNRDKTGICPMEEAVKNIESPDEAYIAVKEKLESLRRK